MILNRRLRVYDYHLKLKPRIEKIRSLEGYYVLSSKEPLFQLYQLAKSKLSFSRWLHKAKQFQPDEVAKIVKRHKESAITVKFSCSYNDILRMSDTPHFKTCAVPHHFGRHCPGEILKDSRSAIIFSPDRSGKMNGRVIVRLNEDNRFHIMRCYGILKFDIVKFFLESLGFGVEEYENDTVVYYDFLRLNSIREYQVKQRMTN